MRTMIAVLRWLGVLATTVVLLAGGCAGSAANGPPSAGTTDPLTPPQRPDGGEPVVHLCYDGYQATGWTESMAFAARRLGYQIVDESSCSLSAAEVCTGGKGAVFCSARRLTDAAMAIALTVASSFLGDLQSGCPLTLPARTANIEELRRLVTAVSAQPFDEHAFAELKTVAAANHVSLDDLKVLFPVIHQMRAIEIEAIKHLAKGHIPSERGRSPVPGCDQLCEDQATLAVGPYQNALVLALEYVLQHEATHARGRCQFPAESALLSSPEGRIARSRLEDLGRRASCSAPSSDELVADLCALMGVERIREASTARFRVGPSTEGTGFGIDLVVGNTPASLLAYWLWLTRPALVAKCDQGADDAAQYQSLATRILSHSQFVADQAVIRAVSMLVHPISESRESGRAVVSSGSHLHPSTRTLQLAVTLWWRNLSQIEICGEEARYLVENVFTSMRRCSGASPGDAREVCETIGRDLSSLVPLSAREALSSGQLPAPEAYRCSASK